MIDKETWKTGTDRDKTEKLIKYQFQTLQGWSGPWDWTTFSIDPLWGGPGSKLKKKKQTNKQTNKQILKIWKSEFGLIVVLLLSSKSLNFCGAKEEMLVLKREI